MDRIVAEGTPCCFDLAVVPVDYSPEAVQKLRTAGKGVVGYFNVHDVQPQVARGEWRGVWWSFVADTVLAEWDAYLVPTEKDTAFYAYYGGDRYLLNWSVIDSTRAERLARAQLRSIGPQAAAFWDVFFPDLQPWMFAGRGASYEQVDAATRSTYRDNMQRGLRIARRVFKKNGQRVPFAVIANGDWNAPPPVMLEGAEQSPLGSFSDAMVRWQQYSSNLASVRAQHTAWRDSILTRWSSYGGLLSFTGDTDTAIEAAYIEAERIRR
jgi:hypothetical protein